MFDIERAFASRIFSLSLRGNLGKNTGFDDFQEMRMNEDIKAAATRACLEYVKKVASTIHCKAECVEDFVANSYPLFNRRENSARTVQNKGRYDGGIFAGG